jgi:hypothetical protein
MRLLDLDAAATLSLESAKVKRPCTCDYEVICNRADSSVHFTETLHDQHQMQRRPGHFKIFQILLLLAATRTCTTPSEFEQQRVQRLIKTSRTVLSSYFVYEAMGCNSTRPLRAQQQTHTTLKISLTQAHNRAKKRLPQKRQVCPDC